MNTINASNPSLINILLQQAAKTKEKKRPTFEEVFAKLNARSARMDPNKNPMNNMLTNEQLFRYYVKDTEPKLRVSDESFNVEDALNPMKDSDPTKVYGRGTTQTSDVIPSRNPYNNAEIIGIPPPAAPAAPAGTKPISGKLAALAQQYAGANTPFAMPPQPRIPTAPAPANPTAYPDISGSIPIPIGNDAILIDYNMAKDELAMAENVINRLSQVDWGTIPPETQTIFSILFNNNDFYSVETTEYMKGLIRAGTIERAIEGINNVFKQTKGNQAVNNFITERMALMMGIDITAGIGAVEKFNKLYNPMNIGIGEGKITMERFTVNILNYLNSQRALSGAEKTRVDRDILNIEDVGLAGNAAKYVGDITNKFQALQIQYDALIPTASALITDLFYDGDTEIRTNTDINSAEIDPEIVKKLEDRSLPSASDIEEAATSLGSTSFSSTIAEAGSPAGVDIDNVLSRRGRGVQAGDVRGSYNKPKKVAGDILGDIIGSAVDIAEAKPKKKK